MRIVCCASLACESFGRIEREREKERERETYLERIRSCETITRMAASNFSSRRASTFAQLYRVIFCAYFFLRLIYFNVKAFNRFFDFFPSFYIMLTMACDYISHKQRVARLILNAARRIEQDKIDFYLSIQVSKINFTYVIFVSNSREVFILKSVRLKYLELHF